LKTLRLLKVLGFNHQSKIINQQSPTEERLMIVDCRLLIENRGLLKVLGFNHQSKIINQQSPTEERFQIVDCRLLIENP
jgi:hypothetical protein